MKRQAGRSQAFWRSLALCVLAVCASAGSAVATADSAVWVVSSGTGKVYLGGTVHLLRPADYPLPEEFEVAYQEAERLFFETDVSAMNDLSVQAAMLQQLMYDDGRTLRSVLSEEAYGTLSRYMDSVGMPVMMVESFKPGLLVSTLQVIEFQKLGFTPQGVDMYFNSRAMSDDKPVGELESVQAQIDYIAGMGEGNESEFIMLSLQELAEVGSSMEDLIGAWRAGDNDQLAQLFVNQMRDESPELYEALLVERNLNWLPIIEQMFGEGGAEFVLVGAAHLVGEDGLLAMLRARGYTVEKL